ncbi:Acyl-CoA N-acyltransferase (NAT) superfamily protein [Forsythia ovata]|uniref:Acyl-CoA N-acyltransferase (NAT) superfamily protein n=1 Tax=Forsythia ovata TaxID=205694 RepID=A0ABD1VDW0_9LAMI
MTTIRRFCGNDVLRFASVNIDNLTVTSCGSDRMLYYDDGLMWWTNFGNDRWKEMIGKLIKEISRFWRRLVKGKGLNLPANFGEKNFVREKIEDVVKGRLILGNVEGQGDSRHSHVTAVTVAPEYRRQQLAKKLMNLMEDFSDKIDKAYFVYLFVRASNTPAINMYEKVISHNTLLDMRKALSQDVEKKSVIPLKRPVTPDELEYD